MAQDWLKFLRPVATAPRTEQYQSNETGPAEVLSWDLPLKLSPEQAALLQAREAERAKNPAVIKSGPESMPFIPDENMRRVAVTQVNSPILTEQDRAKLSDLERQFRTQFADQKRGVDASAQAIQDFRTTPSGLDFTPMAALADKWSGGGNQLTQAAQSIKGLSQADKEMMLQKMQAQQTGLEGDLTKELAARLRGLEDNRNSMRLMDMNQKSARQERNLERNLSLKFNQDLRQDTKGYAEVLPSFGAVEDALKTNERGEINAARLQMALSNAARLMGEKGVLTDQDIGRIQQKSLETMANQVANFATGPNATIPEKYVMPLKQAIAAGKASWINAAKTRIGTTKETYKAIGMQPELADKIADDVYGKQLFKTEAPAPKGLEIDENAIDAELARRGMK